MTRHDERTWQEIRQQAEDSQAAAERTGTENGYLQAGAIWEICAEAARRAGNELAERQAFMALDEMVDRACSAHNQAKGQRT
jgi:hypothetical protein